MSCKQFIRQVDTAVNDKTFGKKYGPRKMTLEKTSRREVSSPESETGRKGSKLGAPAEIGRYHMYDLHVLIKKTLVTNFEVISLLKRPLIYRTIDKRTI